MAVWENTALTPKTGAYHSSEIPIVLGTNSQRPNSTPDTTEEAKLSSAMVHAWAEFAKSPTTGLANMGWPQYDPRENALILLGNKNQSALTTAPSTQFDALCNRQTQPATGGNTTATDSGTQTQVSGAYANSSSMAFLLLIAALIIHL